MQGCKGRGLRSLFYGSQGSEFTRSEVEANYIGVI